MNDDVFNPFDDDEAPILRHKPARRVRLSGQLEHEETLKNRRESAEHGKRKDPNPLRDDGIDPLDGYAIIEFKRPGVQNGVFRRLKQGRYGIEARLDLHRHTVADARKEVFEFINEALKLGLRSVLIVHGRGNKSQQGQATALLKGYVNHWLRELEPVLAFSSARPEHGSTGSVYVLIRKSDEKKLENRLHFAKGRVPPGSE